MKIKSDFIIIGLTGAIGSGCSTLGGFLANSLEKYKNEIAELNKKIEVQIGNYYRALKKIENTYLDHDEKLDSEFQDLFLDPEDFYEKSLPEKEVLQLTESRLKILNRQLRKLLLRRKLFEYYCNIEWPAFQVISMSTLIIKFAVEHSLDDSLKKSKQFNNYFEEDDQFLPGGTDLILDFAKKNISDIKEFNEKANDKFINIDLSQCKKFDQLIHNLSKLKNELLHSKYIGPEWLQNIGDNLRGTGNSYTRYQRGIHRQKFEHREIISKEVNKWIKFYRSRCDQKEKDNNYFVIDSFRNPEEVQFFRKRYGSFFLCSLYANKKLRIERVGNSLTEGREKRDQGETKSTQDLHKQDVPGCVLLADYAINNDSNSDHYKLKILKLLCLIDKPGIIFPSVEEVSMNLAYNVSLRSTCISRQVGAVITNSEGFVIATGWNDVGSGQMGCSLNCIEDYTKFSDVDCLLSVWSEEIKKFKQNGFFDENNEKNYFCFKDLESAVTSSKKIDNAYKKFCEKQKNTDKTKEIDTLCRDLIDFLKKNVSIKRLEFARALHAEENAILQAARFGGTGIAGGTIYSTTFPCELCAKKIYQSQIKRVVYTEPYPESISETIFFKDGVRQIKIEQFEGVKSPSFFKLFKSPFDLKESQKFDNLI